MTLLEMLLVLFLTGVLGVTLASSINLLLRLTDKTSSDVTRSLSVLQAVELISDDARQANGFLSLSAPDYGSFTSTLYGTGGISIPVTVTYSYDSGNKALVRKVITGTETVFFKEVAQNIESQSDVSLSFTPYSLLQDSAGLFSLSGGAITASITSTVEAAGRGGAEVFTATATAHLRNEDERTVSAPGPTPTPLPVPGEIIYKARVITVTVSSSPAPGSDFERGDPSGEVEKTDTEDGTLFFDVDASTGASKNVVYVVDSQPITQTGLTKITVNFSSQTDRKNTEQRIFVYNCNGTDHRECPGEPGYVEDDDGTGFAIDDDGFHPTDDDIHTFTTANQNVARSFELAAEDVTWVNGRTGSEKFIRIAIRARNIDDANFDLKTDLIQFRVVGD